MPNLLELPEARTILRLRDSSADTTLQLFLDGVNTVVEERVGPVSTRNETVEVRRTGTEYVLPHMNVVSLVSGVEVASGTAVDVTAMYVSPGGILRRTDGGLLPTVVWRLTYVAGMADVPPAIKRGAAEILILAWATRRQIPGADEAEVAPPFLISYRAEAWFAGYERPPRIS